MYDPREIREFRDAVSLVKAVEERTADGAPAYVIIGNLQSMAAESPDLLGLLNDSGKFELVKELYVKHALMCRFLSVFSL